MTKTHNNNGKVLFINEEHSYKYYLKHLSYTSSMMHHIGKWLPNQLTNIKTLFKRYFHSYFKTQRWIKKKKVFDVFYGKFLPSIALFYKYKDISSLKSLIYEFKKLKIPLLSTVNTDADVITLGYWAMFNNKNKKSVILMINIINKWIIKNSFINKKRIFNLILNSYIFA